MNVLILTWEYPPKRLGNVSDHVATLAHELVKRGHNVEIVVVDDWRPGFEDICGVHVHRIANPVKTHPMASVLTYVITASTQMEAEASNIIYFYRQHQKRINLIHVHEWLTVPPAISLKHAFNIPFIVTFHSIEGHRCHNNFGPTSIAIKEIEDMGIWESARVIANTEWLKNEILRYYGGGHFGKIDVVWPVGDGWVDKIVSVYEKVVG
ncbi:MAG: glycosyltransferase [Candidatus Bathyarchaeia archaeon]